MTLQMYYYVFYVCMSLGRSVITRQISFDHFSQRNEKNYKFRWEDSFRHVFQRRREESATGQSCGKFNLSIYCLIFDPSSIHEIIKERLQII